MSILNTGALKGVTLFISGGSRGIGKAIALKAARDGANIVLAAKTATAHPKLPGTIYTAAKEIEDAGGKCLPCICDIRDEMQVDEAVARAVKEYGSIDIVVNNASAISLTGTRETPMKRYDLMHQVNGRGTYLITRACLPFMTNTSRNRHILNISPPLNMKPHWFKNHVAYTMAKYNMSMCVLGMAEEFRDEGIAVNGLWPKTAISTAAMEMLGGGKEAFDACRKDTIMADAAYAIFTSDSKEMTGQFVIDEEILRARGVTDFEQYAETPGAKLMPDFFLDVDENGEVITAQTTAAAAGAASTTASAPKAEQPVVAKSEIEEVFSKLRGMASETIVARTKGVYQFHIGGSQGGQWYLDLKNGAGDVQKGEVDKADCTMTMSDSVFLDMFSGKTSATSVFFMGKLKIKGDMTLAMKLERLLKTVVKSKL